MKTLATLTLAILSSASFAQFAFSDISYWTGSGSNRSALVVDFKNGGPSFVWGYQFDGSKTGQDMIQALAADAETGLSIQITSYSFGDALTGLSFRGNSVGGFNPGSDGYLAYYLADGSSSAPSTWIDSQVGMGGRQLSDNSWDGWSWAANFNASVPSANLVAAVPEPMTLSILGIGLAGLGTRRRRRN